LQSFAASGTHSVSKEARRLFHGRDRERVDIDPVNAAFSTVLKDIRERIGLPSEQFAARLGYGREQYADLENPVWGKKLSDVFKVARGLGIEPDLLVAATRVHIIELLTPALKLALPAPDGSRHDKPKT
jgi:transcriptional regulator with XRE-family HTH domain